MQFPDDLIVSNTVGIASASIQTVISVHKGPHAFASLMVEVGVAPSSVVTRELETSSIAPRMAAGSGANMKVVVRNRPSEDQVCAHHMEEAVAVTLKVVENPLSRRPSFV